MNDKPIDLRRPTEYEQMEEAKQSSRALGNCALMLVYILAIAATIWYIHHRLKG